MINRPSVIDLFSGVGGMSLGMEAAGFDIDISLELNPIHAALHHFNFPYSSTICGDIKNIKSIALEQKLISRNRFDLDLIVGGPPCQGFSQMGKRQLNDPRNQLVFEYVRIIKDLKPKFFIFENVPGIIAGKHKQFVIELIEEMEKFGYNVTFPPQILNAANYGVAQNRKRFILLGSRQDQEKLIYPEPLFINNGVQNLFSKTKENFPTAYAAIHNLEKHNVFIGKDKGLLTSDIIYNGYAEKFSFKKSNELKLCHTRNFHTNRVWGHIGSKHTPISIQRFKDTKAGTAEKVSRFFKLSTQLPCNTLRAGTPSGKGAFTAARPIHYTEPRCITIREAARLHSYPDWFNFHRTIWHGFRQIGNSVAPFFAKSIGNMILNKLNIDINKLTINELEAQDENLALMNMTQATRYFGYHKNYMPTRNRIINKQKIDI